MRTQEQCLDEERPHMPIRGEASFYSANSLSDALSAIGERGPEGQAIAGGTWVMRAALRGEPANRAYVSLARIDSLRQVVVTDPGIEVGACVTHAQLARALHSHLEFRGLAIAAGASANPAVRNVATVGGNLCAVGFPAADLVPSLMALAARVELNSNAGAETMSVEDFVKTRSRLEPGRLVQRIILSRSALATTLSSHVRLPLREAGDYPVAIVSIAVSLKQDGTVERARVVVGSVESIPRRWLHMEVELIGHVLDPARTADRARILTDEFVGRDGVEAPGWYRVKVLPTLMKRAIEQLRSS